MASLMDILAGAGNLLDLPGSSLRDILSGRNPFDQWATPFSDVNRASGRDVLQPFLGANEETGMAGWADNPMEGLKDIAGFGAEMLLDPLNLVPLGAVGKALKGRKAARSANTAMKAERGGKYALVNPKVAGRVATEAAPVADNPMRLLGYTPPSMSIADRLQESAKLRKQRDDFFNNSYPDNVPYEEMTPFYDELHRLDNEARRVDPTFDDRVAEFYSKPIVGVPREDWLAEVGGKNQSLRKILRGLDMSQPDDQMILKNLGSAFDGSANPFAEEGPLMSTMKQFAGDVADVDSQLVDPLYSAIHDPRFFDLVKRTASDLGEKVDDNFEHLMPELFHEGPTSRQARMFKSMREGIPRLLDEPHPSNVKHYLEQILNVSNIYKDPIDAAKFEYDRQLAKFSTNVPNLVQKNPMLPMQQVKQPVARAADSPLVSTMNPMQLQPEPSLFPAAIAGAVYNALQAFNGRGGIQ